MAEATPSDGVAKREVLVAERRALEAERTAPEAEQTVSKAKRKESRKTKRKESRKAKRKASQDRSTRQAHALSGEVPDLHSARAPPSGEASAATVSTSATSAREPPRPAYATTRVFPEGRRVAPASRSQTVNPRRALPPTAPATQLQTAPATPALSATADVSATADGSATADVVPRDPPATPDPAARNPRRRFMQNQRLARSAAVAHAEPVTIDGLRQSLATYLPQADVAEVTRAYDFAKVAHDGQRRRTGHQYITHPVAVAGVLTEMRMDRPSIMAAILHDVLEDTGVSKPSLAKSFGAEVAEIVDGVSKLGTIFKSRAEAQAENFQKMAIATAKDLRVILVKIADRLHNMRTIAVMSPEKRKRIARETLEFYAPIANRLGMNAVRVELEDLAFQSLFPLRAERLQRAVTVTREASTSRVEDISRDIEASLRREGIEATVASWQRHLYSIYRKMKAHADQSFKDIMDVFGFRIIVDQVDTCYRALGVVHNLYKPVSGRFNDYIAIPKANGYQSLHSDLFGMHGMPIEVQIRTRQMDTMAHNGIAGHWLYTGDEDVNGSRVRARQWMASVLDLQQRAGNSLEFIESLKIDLFPDEVYVFSPTGEIFELPEGACPVDFAYAVHTDVGNHCVGCRVDRTLSPLSVPLQSGQTVEIITADDGRPTANWLEFVVSGKARTAIRQALKAQQRWESSRLGRHLLDRSLANGGTSIDALDYRRLRKAFKHFGVRKFDDLLVEIGLGNLMAYVVAQRLLTDDASDEAVDIETGGPVTIRGGDGLVISYARCCGPVPGDQLLGHMTPGKGFVVHVDNCHNVREQRRRHDFDMIPARWAENTHGEFETTLHITVSRRKGDIAELAAAVNAADAGIDNIAVDERSSKLTSVRLALSVRDRAHLDSVRQRLRSVPAVQQVHRAVD